MEDQHDNNSYQRNSDGWPVRSWRDSYAVNRQLRHWFEITRAKWSGYARARMFLHDKTFFPCPQLPRTPFDLSSFSSALAPASTAMVFAGSTLFSATSSFPGQILTELLLSKLTQLQLEKFPSAHRPIDERSAASSDTSSRSPRDTTLDYGPILQVTPTGNISFLA